MTRTGRNELCPCGSGRKFKVCCLRNESVSDATKHPLLLQALECFHWGYFEGAVNRCEKLETLSYDLTVACSGVAWLSRVCSGRRDWHDDARHSRYLNDLIQRGVGGQSAAELMWLFFNYWKEGYWEFPNGVKIEQKSPFEQVVAFIEKQHGVLVGFHPTAILSLAELACRQDASVDYAVTFVSCALGWRTPYADVADVERLAKLLVKLKAPITLWADWATIFLKHIKLSHFRASVSAQILDASDFRDWAKMQDFESEHVLLRVLSVAPSQLSEILKKLSSHVGMNSFANVLENREWPNGIEYLYRSSALRWYCSPNINARYFWFDMLAEDEQNFVTNGDWALFSSPTTDYSMGLAQWWRLIESLFARVVTHELGKLYDENPDWLAIDSSTLSKAEAQREEVFLKKLARPEHRNRMTLADILRVLEKCVVSPKVSADCRSILRLKATEYFSQYRNQILDSIDNKPNPIGIGGGLTAENIDWFRNKASHVDPIDEVNASVGRVIAKKIIETFYIPALHGMGFKASIPVFYDPR